MSPARRQTSRARSSGLGCRLHVGRAVRDGTDGSLMLTVPDASGTYTIPYIQTARSLTVRGEFPPVAPASVELTLTAPGGQCDTRAISPDEPEASFDGLEAGEYTLSARARDADGGEMAAGRCERIGVGTVVAALGDSITEGYHGAACRRDDLDLTAGDFPAEMVSADGRNFPQFAPTTGVHKPEVNCMQSWMTELNDMLAARLGRPVFIANEGWGGYTAATYLELMRTDANWQRRMELLAPDVWAIHLGVNDGRSTRPAADVAGDFDAMIDILCERHGAAPGRILIARPCYDYWPDAEPRLRRYCEAYDELIARRGCRRGPDFFDAYSRDRQRYYGDDPVHPNVEGMTLMARLWCDAIAAACGTGKGAHA